jgi:UDP-glucose 4-epimerase
VDAKGSVLVTGGAGFIGSHLAELLLDEEWTVYVLDDLSTGSIENVHHLQDNPRFHLVVESVLSPAVVNELVYKCDLVYHLAAAVGVRLIVEQPVQTLVTNIDGTAMVLEQCSKFGKRVLIASSESSARTTGASTARPRHAAGPTRTRRRWTSS